MVAADARCLVFCEVKTRIVSAASAARSWARSRPSARRKQRRLQALAREWLAEPGDEPPGRPSCASTRSAWSWTRAGGSCGSTTSRARSDARRLALRPRRPRRPPARRRSPARAGVGDRLERQAVQRRDAVLGDRRAMLGRGVAHVGLEVPLRVPLGDPAHVAVAADLGQHRGRGDRRAAAVAVDDRALLEAEVGHVEAVHEADGAVAGHAEQRACAAPRGSCCAARGRRCPARSETRSPTGPRRAARAGRAPRALGRVLLRVVQAAQRAAVGQRQPLEVEQHRGRHERPGQRAAAGLVGAGHVAAAELAVEGEQAAAAALAPAGAGTRRAALVA